MFDFKFFKTKELFCKGVVRIGGRCKNENLRPYLLTNLRNTFKNDRLYDRRLINRIGETKDKLTTITNKIDRINFLKKVISTSNVIISFGELEELMEESHQDQLLGLNCRLVSRSNNDYTLLDWLGFFDENKTSFLNFNEPDLSELYSEENSQQQIEKDREEQNIAEENLVETQMDNNDDDDADDKENDERMLENDFNIIKNSKSPTIDKRNYNQLFISQEEIANMRNNYEMYKYGKKDSEGFQVQGGKKKNFQFKIEHINNYIEYIFGFQNQNQNFSLVKNIWELNYRDRFQLYNQWFEMYKQKLETDMARLSQEFNLNSTTLQELRMQEDRSILNDALIIAMTTTGSARYHSILNDIGPRIVIVEEAAEVFEAHIVSSLSKHCEHLILIGDHVQLRPSPSVFKMASTYKLDVSLFERLINNKTKSVMLTCQHRMRPEISVLMKHFYNQPIADHESVSSYPNVIGLKNNIFFFNHNKPESEFSELNSKKNTFEALFIAKFCSYLIKQKYQKSQITILTMYLGQLIEIRNLLKRFDLSGIKVSTVDNYQGEENDIVLLSLVRSNEFSKIGFLKINNRVCVALSRAKIGFYCIGNFDLMSQNSLKWAKIIESAKQTGNYGEYLTLSCGLHENNDIQVKEQNDFDLRPDGGCNLKCNFRLICGHVCGLYCHTFDLEHKDYECLKKCDKLMENCGHYCQKKCSHIGECDECKVLVEKVIEECGHKINFRCDRTPKRINCLKPCENVLNCGHKCIKYCGNLNCEPCETIIEVSSACDHNVKLEVYCHEPPWKYIEMCQKECGKILSCEHRCKSKCGKCYAGRIHANCTETCDRILFCGHKCTEPCAQQCQPCKRECENRCEHSKCNFLCSDPCSPCLEKCNWGCNHSICTKLCHEICDKKPCNKPCNKKLKCRHKCVGFCGEPCPYLCRVCNREELSEIFSAMKIILKLDLFYSKIVVTLLKRLEWTNGLGINLTVILFNYPNVQSVKRLLEKI